LINSITNTSWVTNIEEAWFRNRRDMIFIKDDTKITSRINKSNKSETLWTRTWTGLELATCGLGLATFRLATSGLGLDDLRIKRTWTRTWTCHYGTWLHLCESTINYIITPWYAIFNYIDNLPELYFITAQRTSTTAYWFLLLIYRPRKDERLSWSE